MNQSFFYIILFISFFSCKKNEKNAFEINGKNYKMIEVDKVVKNQIFDHLYGIYLARDLAINRILEEELIILEKQENNLTEKQILLNFEKENNFSLDLFQKINKIEKVIFSKNNPFFPVKIESKEGKKLLNDTYSDFLKNQLFEKLKIKYNYKNFNDKPELPSISLENILYNEITPKSSNIEIRLISNFNCESCLSFMPIFEKIVSKYENQIYFSHSFLNYEQDSTTKFGVFVNKKGKFKDYFFKYLKFKNLSEKNKINLLKLNLNEYQIFKNNEKEMLKIQNSFSALNKLNIHQIPTLIIDNKIYSDSYDFTTICKYIDNKIDQNK